MTTKTFFMKLSSVMHKGNMLVYQTKYSSQSMQFKLFRSISVTNTAVYGAYVLTHFCEFC